VLRILWILATFASAQSDPGITVAWPSSDKPTLQLTFGSFQQNGVVNGDGIFLCDVTAQNVSDQSMPRSIFTVFLSDKKRSSNRPRSDAAPGDSSLRSQKAQLQFSAAGTPSGVTLLAGKTVPLKVISVPPGANFRVDGDGRGLTPKGVDFTIGSPRLEFSKEGFAPGTRRSTWAPPSFPAGASALS
jgi:hypothetical protein